MTWKIGMTWKMKDVVVVFERKDEFENIPQITQVIAIPIASSGHPNSSPFHCS